MGSLIQGRGEHCHGPSTVQARQPHFHTVVLSAVGMEGAVVFKDEAAPLTEEIKHFLNKFKVLVPPTAETNKGWGYFILLKKQFEREGHNSKVPVNFYTTGNL